MDKNCIKSLESQVNVEIKAAMTYLAMVIKFFLFYDVFYLLIILNLFIFYFLF